MRHRIALVAAALAVAACGRDPDPPGALSADDERQLNEAAAMLDANAVEPETVADNGSDRE
jgi:hypothetical protein